MSIASFDPLATVPPELTGESLRRFTVAEYHELIDRGFFAEDGEYELLEGWLVHKQVNWRLSLAAKRLAESR